MLLHKSVQYDSRVRREAASLAAAGHEVVVLELARPPAGSTTLDGFQRLPCIPPAWIRRLLPRIAYRATIVPYFVWGVIRVRPQVVHAHDAAMLVPGAIGAWIVGARLIYDSHELATSVPYRSRMWAWLTAAIERAVVPRSDAVITVSDGIAARLRARYRLRMTPTVVRNVSALRPVGEGGLRARLALAPETPLVLHQGAPAPARGCEVLIRAVASLDGVHLVFLGDPEPGYGEALAREINGLGVASRVGMLDSVALDDLLAHTAEADVGVTLLQDTCDNHRLALPNKLFEYIAAGVPVVASALPETERLVSQYGVGWCVTPDDPQRLAAALAAALAARSDPALQAALRRAAGELRWDVEQARLIALYAELAGGRRGPRHARAPA